jgi:glycosyltransferase involved in cell wall biosynthesis
MLELDRSFPCPTAAALGHADRVFAALEAGTITLVDSLALGAMPDIVARAAVHLPIVALVHLPLAAAPGLDEIAIARVVDGERRALAAAARVIVTGRSALPLIARYGVAPDRVVVVEPGTDRPPLRNALPGEPIRPLELLTVATIGPGKGHATLLHALSGIADLPWRLTCAGSLTRHPAEAARVRATATRLQLCDRVVFAGDLDLEALDACYARADIAVLATERETYGMAVAEALAHGIPVVATITGAIPELVGDEAGVLVPVGDAPALRDALVRVLGDASLRTRLARGARVRRDRLPTWEESARLMASVLAPLCRVPTRG